MACCGNAVFAGCTADAAHDALASFADAPGAVDTVHDASSPFAATEPVLADAGELATTAVTRGHLSIEPTAASEAGRISFEIGRD